MMIQSFNWLKTDQIGARTGRQPRVHMRHKFGVARAQTRHTKIGASQSHLPGSNDPAYMYYYYVFDVRQASVNGLMRES